MQSPMGQQSAPSTTSAAPGRVPSFGRTPSTTVILNLSREKLNRGGARPIFPSACALPTLQANLQRMQMTQGMGGGMQQPNLSQLQQLMMQQQAGLGQQQSMAGMIPGMQGMQGSMGAGLQGLQGMPGIQGMGGMQQRSPSIVGQASIGTMPPGNLSIGLNMGMGGMGGMSGMSNMGGMSGMGSMGNMGGMGMQPQQQQMANLLAQQQQSNLLSALQSQQGRMLGQQSSGQMMPMGSGMMNQITGTVSSNPQLGMLGASIMSSPAQLQQQKSQSAFSSLMASNRPSKPLLQTMETLQGGAPGVQGISGPPALTGTPAPIVMSQPITSAGLAPQMQHLLLKGMPGYSSTLVLILVPQD